MQKQHSVRPVGQAQRGELLALWIKRRRGFFLLQAMADQSGVAVDVSAYLQHWRLAIAAGQGSHIGFGQNRRDDYRTPRQPLETEHQARLLGEQGGWVVMQDQF